MLKRSMEEIKVDPTILNHFYSKKRSKIRYFFAKINAKFHLRFICPRCSQDKGMIRDIEDKGECFWESNWKNENYDIPMWMGFVESKRIRKELKSRK